MCVFTEIVWGRPGRKLATTERQRARAEGYEEDDGGCEGWATKSQCSEWFLF